MRWIKRTAAVAGVLLLLWASAWVAVPPLVKWQAQTRLSALVGRSVTLGDVSFNPWALELTVDEIVVGAGPGASSPSPTVALPASGAAMPPGPAAAAAEPLLRVARVRANFAFWPLFRGVPVIEALDIDAPQLSLARLSPGHYDVDDLIDRFTRRAGPPAAEPTQFALYNLQVRDARLRFDDRPAGRVHRVEALQLALPFLSTLPAQAEIKVEPHLAFKLNGTSFDSDTQATPLARTEHALLKLAVADLDVGPYLGYLPRSLPVRLTRGAVSADLALEFTRPRGGRPSISLRGWVGARDMALSDASGAPLLSWRQLRLGLRDVQPLVRRLAFDTLRIEGAQVHVARDAAGRFSALQTAASAPGAPADGTPRGALAASAASATAATGRAATPWQISLNAIEFVDGRVLWNDAAVKPAAALQLDDLSLVAKQVQWPMARPVPLSLAGTLRAQDGKAAPAGRVTAQGQASDREAKLTVAVSDLALDRLAPYLQLALVPRVEGRLSAQTTLEWSAAANAPRLQFAIAHATLDALRVLPGGGRAAQDGAALEQLALADVQVDVPARTVTLGSVKLVKPSLLLARDPGGRLNVARWLRSPGAAAGAAKPHRSAKVAGLPWQVQVRSLMLEGGRIRVTDALARRDAGEPPLRAELRQLQLGMQNFSWFGDRATPAAKLQLSALVSGPVSSGAKAAPAGKVDWKGEVGFGPMLANGSLRIVRFPVQLFERYFADLLPVSLLRAEAGYTGRLSAREQAAGWAVTAAGDVLLGDVHVTTLRDPTSPAFLATGADELLSWQSFAFKRVKFTMRPGTQPQLEIGEQALTDFYSRLVVTEQGRFNLQEVGAAAPAASAAGESRPAAQAGLPLDVSVGTTTLSNGRIDFSDHFIRPNYSASLTELNGELGPFRSTTREMAALQLRGRAAGTALLEISGQINPTVRPLALDIKARATDLELAPLSPYAGKYAGYAIERGKLSLDVAYKIDADGKLQATNQLVLNQLTFGERIESPSATKLPVLLAVALLKDRHGVIDINLPVSGSVNDPKFSVGGIIFKLILNLLAKALTAPFALLAGGGSQDLSFVEFMPGTAVIADAGSSALEKVAKALTDRPALKMTVTGTADLASEREAYQREAIDTRLIAERRREGLRAGAAASAPVTLAPEDRARLLKALYRQTDLPDKPRNALGLAKDIPGPEMESLLRKNVPVTAEAMRELALQRGIAVRDALIAKGLTNERLFLAAPKVRESGEGDVAWTPRVQLSLSVK